MPTLADVRTQLRRRLEDTTPIPLWSDTQLTDALADALAAYTARFPDEALLPLTVANATTTVPLPADALSPVRLLAPTGAPVEDWRLAAGQLLTPPLPAGTYTLHYRRARPFPPSDSAPFPVPDPDLPLVLADAACRAVELRLLAEAKRGPLPPTFAAALTVLRSRAEAELARRTRRLTPTSLAW